MQPGKKGWKAAPGFLQATENSVGFAPVASITALTVPAPLKLKRHPPRRDCFAFRGRRSTLGRDLVQNARRFLTAITLF